MRELCHDGQPKYTTCDGSTKGTVCVLRSVNSCSTVQASWRRDLLASCTIIGEVESSSNEKQGCTAVPRSVIAATQHTAEKYSRVVASCVCVLPSSHLIALNAPNRALILRSSGLLSTGREQGSCRRLFSTAKFANKLSFTSSCTFSFRTKRVSSVAAARMFCARTCQ